MNRTVLQRLLPNRSSSLAGFLLVGALAQCGLGTGQTFAGDAVAANSAFAGQISFLLPAVAAPAGTTVPANTMWVGAVVPLLEGEVGAFVKTIQAGGLTVIALQHHLVFEKPRTPYAHIEGSGDPATVSSTVKTALDATGSSVATLYRGGGTGLNVPCCT